MIDVYVRWNASGTLPQRLRIIKPLDPVPYFLSVDLSHIKHVSLITDWA